MANVAFVVGIIGIYGGLSMYKWINPGWKIISAPMAILGVFAIGYSIAIFTDAWLGLFALFVFGGIVSFALFRIGQENL